MTGAQAPSPPDPRGPAAPVAVTVDAVSKHFGPTRALDRVSTEIRAGETRGLIGRNGAGKSTLVGLLTGLHEPTAGSIRLWGEAAPPTADRQAWRRLVGTVHQHSTLQRDLTVAENLFIGDLPTGRRGLIDWRATRARAREVLDEWQLALPVTARISELTLAERQLVEIARELSRGASFIILDEPTSRLANAEIERLYGYLARLREQGVTLIYISHHLNEVMTLCDSVTVLKDGRHVVTRQVAETEAATLVADMVGDVGRPVVPERTSTRASRLARAERRLLVEDLTADGLEPLSFQVRAGEVLGVAGLVGSGKELLAEVLAGQVQPTGGRILIGDRTLERHSVAGSIRAGLATVPGDRHRSGQVPGLGIGENVTMSITRRLCGPGGFLSPARRRARASELMDEVAIVAASGEQPARSLSGGNQQKGVVARALATDPEILVLVNPTTGVDIASKATIFDIIERRRARGMSVVLLSDELEEYALCDRVLVLFGGRQVATFERPWAASELLSAIEGVRN